MEALLEDGTRRIKAVTNELQSGSATLEDFVEFLWRLFSGRFFYLSLEMITKSRNDAELRVRMIPVVRRFHEALDEIWTQFCVRLRPRTASGARHPEPHGLPDARHGRADRAAAGARLLPRYGGGLESAAAASHQRGARRDHVRGQKLRGCVRLWRQTADVSAVVARSAGGVAILPPGWPGISDGSIICLMRIISELWLGSMPRVWSHSPEARR